MLIIEVLIEEGTWIYNFNCSNAGNSPEQNTHPVRFFLYKFKVQFLQNQTLQFKRLIQTSAQTKLQGFIENLLYASLLDLFQIIHFT